MRLMRLHEHAEDGSRRMRSCLLAAVTAAFLLGSGVAGQAVEMQCSVGAIVKVTDATYRDRGPQVSDGRIVWTALSGEGDIVSEIFTWRVGDTTPTQLTDHDWAFPPTSGDHLPQVSGERLVWSGLVDGSSEIFTWKTGDATPTRLTFNSSKDLEPQISGDRIVWRSITGSNSEIYTWKVGDVEATKLTDGGVANDPHISGDRIVWEGFDGNDGEIFTWCFGDTAPTQLTDNESRDGLPDVSGDRVVWASDHSFSTMTFSGVSTWKAGDPAPTVLSRTANIPELSKSGPKVSGDRVVWVGLDGDDAEIFTWKTGDAEPTQVTDTQYRVDNPQVFGDRIVWYGPTGQADSEIFTWAAGDTAPTQLTDNAAEDINPQISGARIAWESSDGENWDVFTTTAREYVPVAGVNRYDTAIKTSQAAFADGSAGSVVIATGTNWPDALGGAALASAMNGPILLTQPAALSPGVMDEIRRLGAVDAYILGGTGAVSEAVESALVSELGVTGVHRIGGASRYETADAIAAATIEQLDLGAGYDGKAFVATAGNFPDALAASPLAAAKGWPIFLCNPAGDPPTDVMDTLGVTDVLVLGGTGAVSAEQEAVLESAFPGRVERLWGVSRYATGVAVATYGVEEAGLSWDGLAFSTGGNFPDALAGGVLAGRNGSVMLLTAFDTLPASVSAKLAEHAEEITKVYYLGGTGAISQEVRDQVSNTLR